MIFKRVAIILLLVFAATASIGCTRKPVNEYYRYTYTEPKKIGVVLSAPGKSEPGANDLVKAGVKKAADELDVEYKFLAPKDLVNNEESLRYLAENNYDLVIAIGVGMQEDLDRIAPDYSDIKFVIYGGEVDRPNVASLRINEEEGAFMAGVEAASLTKSNLVGYVGGSITTDHGMEGSFARGVQYVNQTEGKTVKISAIYAGLTGQAANDPERGKTLANNLYWTGSDVVFTDAGRLASGVSSAAIEKKKIAICGDIQVMNAAPWTVYGAVVKKQDTIVYDLVKKVLQGTFTTGRNGFGIAEGAVDFTASVAVAPEVAGKLTAIKDKIKKGLIKPFSIQIPQGLVTQINQTPVDLNKPPAATTPGSVLSAPDQR